MSSVRFGRGAFLVAYSCAYTVVLAYDLPMFRYYPLHGDFSWGRQVLQGVGPGMAWYGLMANAAAFAVLAAFVVPERITQRALGGWVWLFPLGAMLAAVFLMRMFFQ